MEKYMITLLLLEKWDWSLSCGKTHCPLIFVSPKISTMIVTICPQYMSFSRFFLSKA
jgi:hypothetical protein